MTLFAPASFAEVRSMLRHAVRKVSGPVALRYPRGGESGYRGDAGVEPTVCLKVGKAITLVTYGIKMCIRDRPHMGLQLPGGHVMPQTGVAGFHDGGHVAEAIVL